MLTLTIGTFCLFTAWITVSQVLRRTDAAIESFCISSCASIYHSFVRSGCYLCLRVALWSFFIQVEFLNFTINARDFGPLSFGRFRNNPLTLLKVGFPQNWRVRSVYIAPLQGFSISYWSPIFLEFMAPRSIWVQKCRDYLLYLSVRIWRCCFNGEHTWRKESRFLFISPFSCYCFRQLPHAIFILGTLFSELRSNELLWVRMLYHVKAAILGFFNILELRCSYRAFCVTLPWFARKVLLLCAGFLINNIECSFLSKL